MVLYFWTQMKLILSLPCKPRVVMEINVTIRTLIVCITLSFSLCLSLCLSQCRAVSQRTTGWLRSNSLSWRWQSWLAHVTFLLTERMKRHITAAHSCTVHFYTNKQHKNNTTASRWLFFLYAAILKASFFPFTERTFHHHICLLHLMSRLRRKLVM